VILNEGTRWLPRPETVDLDFYGGYLVPGDFDGGKNRPFLDTQGDTMLDRAGGGFQDYAPLILGSVGERIPEGRLDFGPAGPHFLRTPPPTVIFK